MEWTNGKKVMAVICGIAILFMLYGIVHFIMMNSQYNKVIEVIKQGDYTRAEEMLTDMNVKHKDDNDERSYFRLRSVLLYECKDTENFEHYFADSAILYIYITAMEYYNDNKFEFASNRINLVPENYSGALCEEIKTSKQEINQRYEEYKQELEKAKEEYIRTLPERMAKEAEEKKQKLEEERASYADKLPYDGMSELFIEYTQLGKPDKYQRTKKDDVSDNERYDIYDTFYWYDKGYVVCCLNGNVRSVSKESTETMEENYSGYWIKEFDSKVINSDVFSKDGRLKEKNSTRSSSGSSHSSHSKPLYGYSHGDSNHSSDSYNVHDYDDPEDFYYDNEDDFDGIDDAETYFYDHND